MKTSHTTFYGGEVTKIEFGGKEAYSLSFTGSFEKPYETKPTIGEHDYNTCKDCQKNRQQLINEFTDRMYGEDKKKHFPFCCNQHKNLIKLREFNAHDFKDVPIITANKVIYTQQHIKNTIENENYYEDITDYIEYTVLSLGSFPADCGGPLFYADYIDYIANYLKINEQEFSSLKSQSIIEFLNNYLKPITKPKSSFNTLVTTYNKWLKMFPFEISFFNNIKEQFERQVIIIKDKPVVNRYTRIAKAKLHTQGSLLETLNKLTLKLLDSVNVIELRKQGAITNVQATKLEFAEAVLKTKTAEITHQFTKGELQYIKAQKRWLQIHKDYFTENETILKELPPQQNHNTMNNKRLYNLKNEVISKHWANGLCGQMLYRTDEITYQFINAVLDQGEYKWEFDRMNINTTNCPIIAKGIIAYVAINLGKSEKEIFDEFYDRYRRGYLETESVKPGASLRDLENEFRSFHLEDEKVRIAFTQENLAPFLSREEMNTLNEYAQYYCKYIESTYPTETNLLVEKSNQSVTSDQTKVKNKYSVSDWAIIFYYLFESNYLKGSKVEAIRAFIVQHNIVNEKGQLTTENYFKKEENKIKNRINGIENDMYEVEWNDKYKPLPPERIEKILPFLKKHASSHQIAKNDIDRLIIECDKHKDKDY